VSSATAEKNDQRLEALQAANAIRRTRATLKKAWRDQGEHEVSESIAMLVSAPPDWAHTWRIAKLLRSIPQWGEVAVNRRLRQLMIQPETPLVALTPGQRLGLVELLAPKLLDTAHAEPANV
jgi:hypothetical protein